MQFFLKKNYIYYTIDATEPDNAGKLYTEPFAVGAGRAVKAVSYVWNDIYSTVDEYVVEKLSLVISQNWHSWTTSGALSLIGNQNSFIELAVASRNTNHT